MSTRAQRALEAGDLVLRQSRRYQWTRRFVLTGSVLWVLGAPLWNLSLNVAQGAGLAATGRWGTLPGTVPAGDAVPLLGAPWTLRLFGVEFMDPLAASSLLAARGFGWQALFGALPALLLTALLGRFFCGWLCPYVPLISLSNGLRSLLRKGGFKPLDIRLPPRTGQVVLGALVLAYAISGSVLAQLVYPPSLIAREAWRAFFQGTLGAGALVVLAAFLFDALVSRAGFCRSLCPGGALFSLLAFRSRIWVQRKAAACTDCTACDAVCNLGQRPMTDVLDAGCERCGKCIAVCPTKALAFAVERGPK